MARPRTPTAVLEARGAFKKNPQRRKARAGEPKPAGGVGAPPDYLSERRQNIWHELALQAPWLTVSDRVTLEIATSLLSEFRRGRMSNEALNTLLRTTSKLGLDPSGRAKVSVPQKVEDADDNPFAAFN